MDGIRGRPQPMYPMIEMGPTAMELANNATAVPSAAQKVPGPLLPIDVVLFLPAWMPPPPLPPTPLCTWLLHQRKVACISHYAVICLFLWL